MAAITTGVASGLLINRWLDLSNQHPQKNSNTTLRVNNVGQKNIKQVSLLKELSLGVDWPRILASSVFAILAQKSITTLGSIFPGACITSIIGFTFLVIPGFLAGNKLYHQDPPQCLLNLFGLPLIKSLDWAKNFFVNDTSHLFKQTELAWQQAKKQVNDQLSQKAQTLQPSNKQVTRQAPPYPSQMRGSTHY